MNRTDNWETSKPLGSAPQPSLETRAYFEAMRQVGIPRTDREQMMFEALEASIVRALEAETGAHYCPSCEQWT
jgi:hypothetical protein